MIPPRRPLPAVTALLLIALALATAALAQSGQISDVATPGVQTRMSTMNTANTALGTLGDMMGGRALFDRDRADAARRILIDSTRAIPSVFRKPHADPLSNARPEIWSNWRDFRSRAKAAQRAARRLDTDALTDLRLTLPKLLLACLNCHDTYRLPMD
ncbi:cytochrome c [Sedimentitalea arenosa]|jgi:cytochrome c556|uniref:Cytochrome c n=1 Tax=Sedimentitalea arenosa TaxID=2798803 RepID=A0A8J7LSX4_9RHOB|nr:cytochrome c [Arenibacterium arenosum]MBJ6372489.1 cytochrome c [Arenibacterium arenosum]